MSGLLQLRAITKKYGSRVIFEDASAVFGRGDRVGVIGRNGSGKTTLCRLITAREEADGGEIVRTPALRLGYLGQEDAFDPSETVLEYLGRSSGREPWRCGKVAGRFRIPSRALEGKVVDLSGGFQTRVKLAAVLLDEPNFLVLDEPTNYLDLRTLMLLERFLDAYSGALLVVSHDREFLRRTCRQTLEVAGGRLVHFKRDIDAYRSEKEERREHAARQNRNIEAKRKHLREFIDRSRVRASTASRAQSKLKELARLEKVEIEGDEKVARIRLPGVERRNGIALCVEDLAIGYPEHLVAEGIRFDIEHGQHVAVLGDNGEGKTTFLRTIAGGLAPRGGQFRWGHGADRAYYAQHVYAALPPELTVLEWLEREASIEIPRQELLDLAGRFLFSDDDTAKPISVLSGGERARLSLAGLLLGRKPVLLLDEPTNHLDFETVEALGAALRDHAGTILFTSHDRTFVRLVATNVVEVKGGRVRLYPSDYESYLWRVGREIDREEGEGDSPPAAPRRAGRRGRREGGRREGGGEGAARYRERKERQSRIRTLRRRAREAERQLESLEAEKKEIHDHYLENPLEYSKERQARLEELGRLTEETEADWLRLQEELERLEPEE